MVHELFLEMAALMESLQLVFGCFRELVGAAWLVSCLGGCRPVASVPCWLHSCPENGGGGTEKR